MPSPRLVHLLGQRQSHNHNHEYDEDDEEGEEHDKGNSNGGHSNSSQPANNNSNSNSNSSSVDNHSHSHGGPSHGDKDNNSSSDSPIFDLVVVAALLLVGLALLVAMVVFIVYMVRRFRSRRTTPPLLLHMRARGSTNSNNNGKSRPTLAQLDSLFPVWTPNSGSSEPPIHEDLDSNCVICLTPLLEQPEGSQKSVCLRTLPKCGHTFHSDCIAIWMTGDEDAGKRIERTPSSTNSTRSSSVPRHNNTEPEPHGILDSPALPPSSTTLFPLPPGISAACPVCRHEYGTPLQSTTLNNRDNATEQQQMTVVTLSSVPSDFAGSVIENSTSPLDGGSGIILSEEERNE